MDSVQEEEVRVRRYGGVKGLRDLETERRRDEETKKLRDTMTNGCYQDQFSGLSDILTSFPIMFSYVTFSSLYSSSIIYLQLKLKSSQTCVSADSPSESLSQIVFS